MESKNIGKVVQIVGAVVDVRFEKDSLPDLLNAIEIDNKGEKLVVEVAQHIGDDIVRCIAMGSTDGLVRGIDAVDTGKAISVPVGKETLSMRSVYDQYGLSGDDQIVVGGANDDVMKIVNGEMKPIEA